MTWPRTARRASAARREPEAAEDRAPGRAGTTLWIADAAIIELRTESRWRGTRGPGLRGVLRWAPRREARAGLRLAVSRRLRLRRDDAKVRTSRGLWRGAARPERTRVTMRRGRGVSGESEHRWVGVGFPSLFDHEIFVATRLWQISEVSVRDLYVRSRIFSANQSAIFDEGICAFPSNRGLRPGTAEVRASP